MKRGTVVSAAKPVLLRKGKLKGKQKPKDKRFNPLDYLNSLIEVAHDHRQETVRKRGHSVTKRELNSAQGHTTPHSERTISSSKLRCKSAYSQYRKRSVNIKDPLFLDLKGLVTQENVINFTEETARGKEERREQSLIRLPISQAVAARKIQRAWRRYQTLKVVRHYYEEYCGMIREQKERKKLAVQQGSSNRLERTLKIKRENQSQSSRNSPNTALKVCRPLFRVLDFSEDCADAVTKELLREEQSLNEPDQLGLSSGSGSMLSKSDYISSELQVFVQMFRNSHQLAAREVQEQLSAFCRAQAQVGLSSPAGSRFSQGSSLLQQSSLTSELQGVSPLVFSEMEKVILKKFQLQRRRLQEQPVQEQRHAQEQLEGRLRRELRAFNNCKEQYLKSVRQLREGMVKMQRDCAWVAKAEGQGAGWRVRKSYSAESLLMKSILEEVASRNKDVDFSRDNHEEPIIECDFRRKRGEETIGLAFPTSPPSVLGQQHNSACSGLSLNCYEVDTDSKLRQALFQCSANSDFSPALEDHSVREFEQEEPNEEIILKCDSATSLNFKDNSLREEESSHLIRECSQEIQQKIEAALIQQLSQELFQSGRFWAGFKPFVEHPFQFRAITDWDILRFLEKDLPKHFQTTQELLRRINQKINPTTLEILRLIRDFQFEVDEYELVLPEEVFRGFRRGLEQQYARRVKLQQQRPVIVRNLVGPIITLVQEREAQKTVKRGKFMCFQRDLRIMYMKAVFNCFNESLIETKSFYTFMNGRSSIGPGELTLALKEYNWTCGLERIQSLLDQARGRVMKIVSGKCSLPEFRSHRDLEQFQREITKQIVQQMQQTEYKWVNYMDEVMQIWQQLTLSLVQTLLEEAVKELVLF